VYAFLQELLHTRIYKRTQGRITRQVTFAALAIGLGVGMWQLSQSMVAWDPGFRSQIRAQNAGKVEFTSDKGKTFLVILDSEGHELERHGLPDGATRKVKKNEEIIAGTVLCQWRPIWAMAGFRFGVPGVLLAGGLWVGYRTVNFPSFADFLIAVEAEMNKVSWPTRTELFRASIVVLFTIFALAILLAAYDFIWRWLFTKVLGIL